MNARSNLVHRPVLVIALIVSLLMTLAVGASHPTTARADDGCEESEQIACLPLPIEELDAGGPNRAPATGAALPRPCPPILSADPTAGAAVPFPVPPGCGVRDIVAAVNRANAVYARALRALDTSELTRSWSGEALADIRGQIAVLRGGGRYATPRLLSIGMQDMRLGPGTADVRTIEHWIYQERSLLSGAVVTELDEWVENLYSLRLVGGSWLVERDVITTIDPPAPPPPVRASASVITDRDSYQLGDQIAGTITNTGTVTIAGGGGFACGMLAIEWFGPDGWQRAPLPDPRTICTLVARLLRPGESHTELLPAAPQPGIYRLAFTFSGEGAEGSRTAYSAPYVVR